MEDYVVGKGVCFLQNCLRAALGSFAVDYQIDALVAGEIADDLDVDPGDGLEFSGPVALQVRPG